MKKIYILLTLIIAVWGCSKFDDINTDPNSTNTVTPAMLATNLILDITQSSTGKSFATPYTLSKMLVWGESGTNEQYNSLGRTSVGYTSLTNVNKMIALSSERDLNAYSGLGNFIKAYKLFYNSLDVGDIPYSEALKGEEGITTPKYDTQKEVMMQVLSDLEKASQHFSNANNFSGDPIYKGDVTKWRRAVNNFRLKVLLHLSKKSNDADLQVKQKFAQIVQNEPLMQSSADNFQLVYTDKDGQYYPFNKQIHKFVEYPMITSVLIDSLKKMNDYRLFYYANPSKYELNNGKTVDDWAAYPGVDPTDIFSNLKSLWSANRFCLLNLRYSDYIPGEPIFQLSFAEQNFIIAEAIVRGWFAGNAENYYNTGITAAMKFVADHTPDDVNYHHNRKITDAYIQTYLSGAYVKFASTANQQLKQILQQKYFMRFMQNPYEDYYEYRRTGYPEWPINPATNLNEVKTKIPVRWMYPSVEYNINKTNIDEAVQRQYNGLDTPNEVMWILKDE